MPELYTAIVLGALLVQYALSSVLDALNLRAMRSEPPPELSDVYDPESYRRSQAYTRARTRFAFWPRTLQLVALLGFWFAGGFGHLDQALRGLALGSIATGLLFFGALALAQGALGLPFRLYSTFVIEERFGFNRTTPRTFATDLLKSTLLGIALGAPLAALVIALFEHAGSLAFLYCWAAIGALTLLLQFIAPRFLMPLFLKFTPLPEGALRTRILEYARAVAFPLDNLFVVDGSRRSSKANAFFTGFGENRRIGLFDTLIERHSSDELVAIVAHEVGHYKKRHVITSMLTSIAYLGVVLFVLGYLLQQPGLYQAFYLQQPSVYAGLVLCMLVFQPLDMLLSLWLLARSRRHEYEADRFAVETTGLAHALRDGLKKLAKDSLGNLTPHPSYVFFHYTHPPLRERIAAIEALQASAARGTSTADPAELTAG